MPGLFEQDEAISYLQRFLTGNKARGMVAELALETYLQEVGATVNGETLTQKVLSGAWLISPRVDEYARYRYAVFVLPTLCLNEDELESAVQSRQKDRGFQTLATFLSQSGIGVIVSAGLCDRSAVHPDQIHWRNYIYAPETESLQPEPDRRPFSEWPGHRGRPSQGGTWDADVLSRFRAAPQAQLTALTLRQAFFYGFLKGTLQKPLADPYDIDGFVVSYGGAVMPLEVKEKSPTPGGGFGIDAGRILMLLRLCLATDSNAFYIIRRVDVDTGRTFLGWEFITLSDIITGCSWNLTAGGRGMLGGATQTVMIPGALFRPFGPESLLDSHLAGIASLQGQVKQRAIEFAGELSRFL